MNKTGLAVGVLLFFSIFVQAADVYKWTDAQGKVHFTSMPPEGKKNDNIEVKNYGTPSGDTNKNAGDATKSNSDLTKPVKEVSPDTKAMVDGMVNALGTVKADGESLDCNLAVESAVSQIDTMIDTAKKNVSGGFMTPEEYEKGVGQLRTAKSEISLSDCRQATGVKKSFYQCMSSADNHVIGCSQKYKY